MSRSRRRVRVTAPQAQGIIEDAIRRGAPAYNLGKHKKCADIYTVTIRGILQSASSDLPAAVLATLQTGLDASAEAKDESARAWALRHGLDPALKLLRAPPEPEVEDMREPEVEDMPAEKAEVEDMPAEKAEVEEMPERKPRRLSPGRHSFVAGGEVELEDMGEEKPLNPVHSFVTGGVFRPLYEFDRPTGALQWQTTNDSVMGGLSVGWFFVNEGGTMEFFGTLSTARNGGFSSVRSPPGNLGLASGDCVVARVRGDGRVYGLNLYTSPGPQTFLSYRSRFRTRKDQWIEVSVPVEDFEATSFGQVVENQPIDPGAVNGVGFVLGDKKPGPFTLEVEWIKVRSPRSPRSSSM